MKKFLLEILAKFSLHMAIASNGKCWFFSYTEKVPLDFDDLIYELNQARHKG